MDRDDGGHRPARTFADGAAGGRVTRAFGFEVSPQLLRIHRVGLFIDVDEFRPRPAWVIASVVAMNVFGTVTTMSRGLTPAAIRANLNASVPLPTPTQ
jgi:hypothetical protein